MQTKNKKAKTVAENDYVSIVAGLDCSVCDSTGPSEVHEIKQGQWFTSCALCPSCHRGPLLGLHGQRRAWLLRKMDETDALAITIQRVFLSMKPALVQAVRARAAINNVAIKALR
jgi:hypothetical protein